MAPSDRRLPGADAPLPSTDDLATLVDGDWYLDEYPDVRRVRARKAAIRGGHAASFRDLSVGYAF
jgi:hypothetical protein